MEALWWHGNENELSFRKKISEPEIVFESDVKIKVAYSGKPLEVQANLGTKGAILTTALNWIPVAVLNIFR